MKQWMKKIWAKVWNWIKKLWFKSCEWVKPYLTPRMIPILLSVWVLTNGIWYVMAFAPINFIGNFKWFARSYIAFLYMPWAPEKIVIVWISTRIYK